MKIKFKLAFGAKLPTKSTEQSAGYDIRSNENYHVVLSPGERLAIKTGLFPEIPVGYEAQIRPRSGLAINHGITVLNSPGTIDSDFRGEICVILINQGTDAFTIERGDRIAQMVIAEVVDSELEVVEDTSNTERGAGGFGHTGVK